MSTLIASLALVQQQKPAAQPSPFSLKMILANLPHDPASVIALILCVAAVGLVVWAGHRKPKDEAPQK
ncbi:MAG: hypothetical protein LJF04_10215 [Gemmatimonadetes bacterium]|nr:hypothetical protein [Gemmatimonadota bacterium]